MPTILRNRPSGKRFEYITTEELDGMLAAGTARKLGMMPSYEETDAPPLAPEPQVYETRELKAAEPAPRRRRTYRKKGAANTDG